MPLFLLWMGLIGLCFVFFYKVKSSVPRFATVYNIDRVFGTVRLTDLAFIPTGPIFSDVVHCQLNEAGMFHLSLGPMMSKFKWCWHSQTCRVTSMLDFNGNGLSGVFSPSVEMGFVPKN